MLPSSLRTLRLVRRHDLQVCRSAGPERDEAIVKDPVNLQYYRLTPYQAHVLTVLDGEVSLDDIISRAPSDMHHADLGANEVLRAIADLGRKGLIWSQAAGTADDNWKQRAQQRSWQIWRAFSNPFFIKLPGIFPGTIVKRLSEWLGWIFAAPFVVLAAIFLLTSGLFLLTRIADVMRQSPAVSDLTSPASIVLFMLIFAILKIVHELSHGIACERFGAECQSIGLAFLFFSPCLYCDVTDAWMIPQKSRRIAISLAGVYAELLIAAVCFWLWFLSAPGLFHQICWQIFLAGSAATVLVNANPLLRYDAYYVLSDWLGIPNLQQKSREAISHLAATVLLGRRPVASLRDGHQVQSGLLVGYGLGSMAFQVPLVIGFGWFLYEVLQRVGLQSLCVIYIVGVPLLAACRLVRWGARMVRENQLTKKSIPRLLLFAATMIATGIAIWHCPLTHRFCAPLIVEPDSVQRVYVETPGTLTQVLVREEQRVRAGDVLIELEDLGLDRRVVALEGILTTHQTDWALARAVRDSDSMTLASTAIDASEDQLEHLTVQKDRLQIPAPISGRIVSLRYDSRSPSSQGTSSLEQADRPLDVWAVGAYFSRGACVCEIAPNEKWQAQAWVDQKTRPFLDVGQAVEVRLDSHPASVLTATVSTVAAANEADVPKALSQRYGGSIPTKSTGAGEESPEPMYRVTLTLDDVDLPLRTGMRGTGRFVRPSVTVGSWAVETFHELFVAR